MSDKFELYQQKYPNLFKEYPRSGFSLCEGWETLVTRLCDTLEWHIKQLPQELREHVYCAQVKEKFGGLRFYMNQETPFVSGAIALAENMSYSICEVCGKPGQRRSTSWVRTLCNTHFKEHKKKK